MQEILTDAVTRFLEQRLSEQTTPLLSAEHITRLIAKHISTVADFLRASSEELEDILGKTAPAAIKEAARLRTYLESYVPDLGKILQSPEQPEGARS